MSITQKRCLKNVHKTFGATYFKLASTLTGVSNASSGKVKAEDI